MSHLPVILLECIAVATRFLHVAPTSDLLEYVDVSTSFLHVTPTSAGMYSYLQTIAVAILGLLYIFRDFLEQYYVPLKQTNPKFPILVRECSGVQPMIWARYGNLSLLVFICCIPRSGVITLYKTLPVVIVVFFFMFC